MKRYFFACVCLLGLLASQAALADSINRYVSSDGNLTQEEVDGQSVLRSLRDKQVTCDDLTESDFYDLGEYFMAQMTGISHLQMDTMFVEATGEQGSVAMHQMIGRSLSKCDGILGNPGWFFAERTPAGWLVLGLCLLAWIGVACVLAVVLRSLFPRRPKRLTCSEDILSARFALGEITRAQFLGMQRDLKTKRKMGASRNKRT